MKFDRQTLKYGFGISLLHLVITLILIVSAYVIEMERFDSGTQLTGLEIALDKTFSLMTKLLINPGQTIHKNIPGALRSNVIEWMLVLLNSALWGFGLLFIWRSIKRNKA